MNIRPLAFFLLAAAPLMAQSSQSTHVPTAPAKTIKVAETPIPPFTVWQLRPGSDTDTQVGAVQLNPGGYWLLLYLDLQSPSSQALLAQLQTLASTSPASTSQSPTVPQLDASKLVIIAAHASGAQISQFALAYPALSSAAWTYDENGAAAKLLGVRGTPHLFGMHGAMQRWQFAGAPKPTDQSTWMTWIAFNRLPKNTFTRAKVTPPQPTVPQSQGASR